MSASLLNLEPSCVGTTCAHKLRVGATPCKSTTTSRTGRAVSETLSIELWHVEIAMSTDSGPCNADFANFAMLDRDIMITENADSCVQNWPPNHRCRASRRDLAVIIHPLRTANSGFRGTISIDQFPSRTPSPDERRISRFSGKNYGSEVWQVLQRASLENRGGDD